MAKPTARQRQEQREALTNFLKTEPTRNLILLRSDRARLVRERTAIEHRHRNELWDHERLIDHIDGLINVERRKLQQQGKK